MPYRRGKKWVGKIEVAGEVFYCGTHDTKTAAKNAEAAKRQQLSKKHLGGLETCGSFATRWPDDYPVGPRNRVRSPQTVAHNRIQIAHFANHPDFRDLPLAAADRPMLMRYARAFPRKAKVMRTMFADAYNDGILGVNHAVRLGIPEGRDEEPVMLTLDEMYAAAAACERVHGPQYGPRFRAMFEFACWTGCRPGELFALTRDKLRPALFEMDITIQTYRDGSQGAPKNKQARTVALPPQAIEAIAGLPPRIPDGLVFSSTTGRPMTEGILTRDWERVRVAAGVDRPDLCWYDATKHFCGSQLALAGVPPMEIGWQLGHTDNGDTARKHYIHLYPSETKQKVLAGFRAREVERPLRGGERVLGGA